MDRIKQQYPQDLAETRLHVLDIPDDYAFMDPELIQILEDQGADLF